jgi:predicted amidohydrolase
VKNMIAACGQVPATTMGQAAEVWPVVARLANEAAEGGVDLFVLPEAAYPAYYLESRERYLKADIERSAKVLERLGALAAKHAFWLVAGFVEEQGERLYNSAAVFDRSGKLVGIARKNFLWDCDHRWFTPGDELSVFETELGRMGVLICADARVPEIPATLVHDGAQFIVDPTAWVNTSRVRRTYRNAQPDFLIRARALEFGVPLVCAGKAGREGTVFEYVGQSQVVDAGGQVLAKAPLGGAHVVGAEITPADPKPLGLDAASRRRLLSEQPPYRPEKPTARPCRVRLRVDVDAIAAELEAGGVRLGRLAVRDLASFAPIRCLALDGAQVVVARGRIADDTVVRTRAVENRVFVVVASDGAQFAIDPDGAIVWRRVDWPDAIDLDIAQADVKQFNPGTDLWAQRRVQCYRL